MGFMQRWENWSREQYSIFGSKLQDRYDFWKDYDDPEFRKKCQVAWALLPERLKKVLYKMVIETIKYKNAEFAKTLVASMLNVYIVHSK